LATLDLNITAGRNGGWLSNSRRYLFLYTGISCLILSAAGCGSSAMPAPPSTPPPSGAPPTPQQSGSVTISPAYGALSTGQTMKFTAAATGGGTLVWSVNGIAGGDTTVGTVDAAGNYTAPAISHSINAVVQAAASAAPQSNFASRSRCLRINWRRCLG